MSRILLLTARDPLGDGDGFAAARTATHLGADHEVTFVLLEDAVTAARADHGLGAELVAATAAGVRVLVESEALSRRAISALGNGIEPIGYAQIADLLLAGSDRQAWL